MLNDAYKGVSGADAHSPPNRIIRSSGNGLPCFFAKGFTTVAGVLAGPSESWQGHGPTAVGRVGFVSVT